MSLNTEQPSARGSRRLRVLFTAGLLVAAAFVLSVVLRLDGFEGRAGAQNMEATYHALWTMRALGESPASAHRFLPTVTLNPDPDHPVKWGATLPTPGGSFIYTSFPPLGFMIPYWAVPLDGADLGAGVTRLAYFNAGIGLVTALGIGLLCRHAFHAVSRVRGRASDGDWLVAGLAAGSYLLLRESLHMHGIVYWPHSLSQLVFVFAAWLAARRFSDDAARWETIPLLGLCLIFPLLEWTGYVFNAGLALACAWRALERASGPLQVRCLRAVFSPVPLAIAALTVLGGLATLVHFVSAVGLGEALYTMFRRASARSMIADAGIVDLARGYWRSFSVLVPVGGIALLVLGAAAARRRGAGPLRRYLVPLFFVLLFPMVENLIMLQHAVQFSFDRAKLAPALLVALAAGLALIDSRRIAALLGTGIAAFVCAANILSFLDQQARYADWPGIMAANARVLAETREAVTGSCRIWGSTSKVRGYVNLAVGDDVHEWVGDRIDLDALQRAGVERGCDVVLIQADLAFPDLHIIRGVTVQPAAAPNTVLQIPHPGAGN